MFYKDHKVGTTSVDPVDIRDDRFERFCSRSQCVCPGFLETYLVVVDSAYKTVQYSRNCDAAFDVGHIGATVQGVTSAVQFVCHMKRCVMPVAGIQIIVDYFQMTGRFLGKYIQQDRVHLQGGRFFRSLLCSGRADRKDCRIWIAIGKGVGSRHQQADIGCRLGPDFKLLDEFWHSIRSMQDKFDHRWRTYQGSIDQAIEKAFNTP